MNNEGKDKVSSFRVQLSQSTKKELDSIAEKNNCYYNQKPSLSILLNQIGSGTLKINKAPESKLVEYSDENDKSNDIYVVISFMTYEKIIGVVSVFSKIIGNAGGNIEQTKIKFKNEKAFINLIIKIHKNHDFETKRGTPLSVLIEKLLKAKFDSLSKEYANNERRFIDVIDHFYKHLDIRFSDDFIKNLNLRKKIKTPTSRLLNKEEVDEKYCFLEKNSEKFPLICDVSCSVWIEIVAKDKKLLLSEVADYLALEGMLIDDIKLECEKGKTYMQLLVNIFNSSHYHYGDDMKLKLERDKRCDKADQNLDAALKKLRGLYFIEKVQRIGINAKKINS